VRILVFHGYLLAGTGSNVYNARLAAALVRLGHEVHLLCQDRHPYDQPFVDAWGDWDEGTLRVRGTRTEIRCTVYRPNIGSLLPVYVLDRYEGMQARTFAQCSDEEIASYVDANVAAVREVAALARPEVALANHLVMGPVILARALGGDVRYAVKVHGSALEYTVKPQPERFVAPAREGLAYARGVLVGSRHTAESLWETLAMDELPARTRLGPPGVDVRRFAPRERAQAHAAFAELERRLAAAAPEKGDAQDTFARDPREAAAALARVDLERDRLVAYVGKLIVSKGVELLIAAWPLVLADEPRARLVVVGFGAYREGLEELIEALAQGRLEEALALARAGRAREDAQLPAQPLPFLLSFLEGLRDGAQTRRARYEQAARALAQRVVLTGRLEHDEVADVLPACEALVVPSTFPEAFGMVAAEAAACGVLPVSAAHSGLAEVSEALARALEPQVAALLSFELGDGTVPAIADRVVGWLSMAEAERARARAALARTVRERWSWEGVAEGVIAAARGELEVLQAP
jgi:glycosyltransferase involved in cell wall biosynthesis